MTLPTSVEWEAVIFMQWQGPWAARFQSVFGLALAQPEKRVLVCTGDGELLMNVGALATVAVMKPANLGILCVDNGHYGETGNQRSHTGQ